MIQRGVFTLNEMAVATGCSITTVGRVRNNLARFGTARSPRGRGGSFPLITQSMGAALQQYLFENPDRYLEEMQAFVLREFDVVASAPTLSRTLARMRWTKKINRRRAKERSLLLRDFYMHKISHLRSWQLVFIDESGCDKLTGVRKTGWAPRGIAPIQVANFHRGKRYQILPAYTQDGVMLHRVFQGTTDSGVFEAFVEQLLPLCGRWPKPRSVLVMDNATIHHSARVKRMCQEAGVLLVYLPPYSPDLNPIEEFFAELKAFIRRNWSLYEDHSQRGFADFLLQCLDVVGSRRRSSRGHLRHAGVTVVEQ